ncbi:MAG: heavy metal-binding domain-containing protein [Gammaproteobacteria bacterium]|nr:MAG: heavy metal-binding domain-containing protein [Gammaproteobacteria bacterium]
MYDLIIFLILLAVGYGFGRHAEKSHYRSIIAREKELNYLPVIATRIPPVNGAKHDSSLVMGSVVISVDYFKRFIAVLRNLVGGRMTSYETLIDRARREAILRMKEHAESQGAEMVFNIKFETSSIYKGKGNAIGSVEVLAYGTALIPR